MQDSLRIGYVAAFAVSGGIVFIAMHAHNRLLSDFFNKIQTSKGQKKEESGKKTMKKKVRFADEAAAESSVEKEKKRRRWLSAAARRSINGESLEGMPRNWQILYKGILQHRNLGRV